MITRTRRTVSFAAASFAALFVVTFAGSAHAAYSGDQLTCREKLAKDGSKLADKAGKLLSGCHKKRSTGKIGAGTDCNDIAANDSKLTVAKAADKLVADANSACGAVNPAEVLYTGCPSPCDAEVPSITDFQDVADCMVCVGKDHVEKTSRNGQGNPTAPMNSVDAKCHGAIGKNQTKLFKTIIKERVKCQKAAERSGSTNVDGCISADPAGKIAKAESKGRAAVQKLCQGADITALDSCSFLSLSNLNDCVFGEARARGRLTFKSFYQLEPGGGVTTTTVQVTTTTVTTTTIPGNQDPLCPNLGELTLLSGTGELCTDNSDCLAGECTGGPPTRCKTATDLDTGWTGIAHDADINHKVITFGNLLCEGPGPVCGECTVTGINPINRTCRCANAPNASFGNRDICDQPFVADANDCGGNICQCYFGPPLPLSAGLVPACVLNRFAEDVSGTANVDTGSGRIEAHLRSFVHLGILLHVPCPSCGGTCTAGITGTCALDEDCDTSVGAGDGVCANYDPTIGDGARGGTCHLGLNGGQSCDVDAVSTTFPAPGGGGHSLDCFPNTSNVSGAGLKIDIVQTTGSDSLASNVPCGQPPFAPRICPCGECSNDPATPCTSNADCGVGNTCAATGGKAFPNQCDNGDCSDTGDGITGECTTAPDDASCDGRVRANGEGFISCTSNVDCEPGTIGIEAGQCTLSKRRKCFLDPIVAVGSPSPTSPIGAGIFCISKTSSTGINSVAGLPGPGRVVNQASSRTFCASDNNVQYQPGIGGCP